MITHKVCFIELIERAIKKQAEAGKNSDQLTALLNEAKAIRAALEADTETWARSKQEGEVVL